MYLLIAFVRTHARNWSSSSPLFVLPNLQNECHACAHVHTAEKFKYCLGYPNTRKRYSAECNKFGRWLQKNKQTNKILRLVFVNSTLNKVTLSFAQVIRRFVYRRHYPTSIRDSFVKYYSDFMNESIYELFDKLINNISIYHFEIIHQILTLLNGVSILAEYKNSTHSRMDHLKVIKRKQTCIPNYTETVNLSKWLWLLWRERGSVRGLLQLVVIKSNGGVVVVVGRRLRRQLLAGECNVLPPVYCVI